jgi:hypothetical protein
VRAALSACATSSQSDTAHRGAKSLQGLQPARHQAGLVGCVRSLPSPGVKSSDAAHSLAQVGPTVQGDHRLRPRQRGLDGGVRRVGSEGGRRAVEDGDRRGDQVLSASMSTGARSPSRTGGGKPCLHPYVVAPLRIAYHGTL